MMGLGMGFGGLGLIFMLLFWVVLIFGGIWLVKTLFNRETGNASNKPEGPQQSTAREILDQRYARGEISREEYVQIKNDL